MRFTFLIPAILAVSCATSEMSVVPTCTEVASQPFDANALTPSGDSASSVLASLALITEDIQLVATSNDGYGSFTDTVQWSFEAAGEPRLATLNGETPSSLGDKLQCPVGDVVFIPVTVTLTSDMGLDLSGSGRVMLDAATGEQWFQLELDGLPVDPGYTTEAQCFGEPGVVTRLSLIYNFKRSLTREPGFENVEGRFTAWVEADYKCQDSVGTMRRL